MHFQNSATRQKPKYFSELANETRLTDHQVREAVTYLRDSFLYWGAGGSNELSPPDKAWVSLGEGILDFDSFDDVLDKIIESHKPKPSEVMFSNLVSPVPSQTLDAHTQRLLTLMESVRAGTRSFGPTSQSASDIATFQQLVRDLEWLHRRGYLQLFKPLRDGVSDRTQFVSVAVGDLTFEGNLFLDQKKKSLEASGTDRHFDTRHGDESMLAFISWSGELSHRIALALREWLPLVLPFIDPWVSSEDIAKGTRWTAEMASVLDRSNYGIICVVPDNVREPWISFEAGAISRTLGVRVSPFLIGLSPRELGDGPLSQFQCTSYDKEDVRKLLHSLNESNSSLALARERVDQNFDLGWPGLQKLLDALKDTDPTLWPGDPDEKMPLIQLFKEAQNQGLELITNRQMIGAFARALQEAGVDAQLKFWGKKMHTFDPLIPIPPEHWRDYAVYWWEAVEVAMNSTGNITGFKDDNFFLRSRTLTHKDGFKDLTVNKLQALDWLKKNGKHIKPLV